MRFSLIPSVVLAVVIGAGCPGTSEDKATPINADPSVTIDAPIDGIEVYQGQPITFSGTVVDDPLMPEHLSEMLVWWESDLAGELSGEESRTDDTATETTVVDLFVPEGMAIGGWVGGLVGAVVGYLLMVGLGNLNSWSQRQWPSCECGNDSESEFKLVEDETHGYAHECIACGARYVMRKGRIWDRLTSTGQRAPSHRRGFLEKWHPVEEIANKELKATDKSAP